MKLKRTKRKSMNSDMDMEYNTGLMEPIMKGNGTTTKLRGKEPSIMLKVISTEVNSRMIWPMDMENTFILMEVSIRENSKMTCRKDMVRKNGSMELSM